MLDDLHQLVHEARLPDARDADERHELGRGLLAHANEELREVLRNVFENARLAGAREVAVSLSGNGRPDHESEVESRVTLVIRDNGHGIPVSLCGDMASEPEHLEALLKAGLRSLSIAPMALGRVRAAIATVTAGT